MSVDNRPSPNLNVISLPCTFNSPSGGVLVAAIVPPVVLVICVLVVCTVLWRRRAQRRLAAEYAGANAQQQQQHQQPNSPGATIAPPQSTPPQTATTAPRRSTPSLPPPPPPDKSPHPAPEHVRRPSFRERFRGNFPGLAARLSGSSRGSGASRADPVLPRAQQHPRPQVFFNSDDMLAPRRARPRSTVVDLGPPLSPPPTQPLPPTPTSAAAGVLGPAREGGRGKIKVRPLPPLPSVPVVLRPNRLGEPGLPLAPQQQEEHYHRPEGRQGEVVLLGPRGRWRERRSNGDSNVLPPPPAYVTPAYGTRSPP